MEKSTGLSTRPEGRAYAPSCHSMGAAKLQFCSKLVNTRNLNGARCGLLWSTRPGARGKERFPEAYHCRLLEGLRYCEGSTHRASQQRD